MPQSLVKNYIHITFSTKNRVSLINKPVQKELFAYLVEICKSKDSSAIIVGGYIDHIHILCNLSRKIALMKLVEELKSHSSKWIKTKGKSYNDFYWQKGYGRFSVNPTEISIVKKYIENQEGHHKSLSYQQEYLAFLKKYNVDFDERYLWG